MELVQFVRDLLRKLSGETAAVLVWTAAAVPVVLIVTAMATDFGITRIEKNRMQNTVDAAALAGTPELPSADNAKATAAQWAFDNLAIGTYGEVTCGAGYGADTKCYSGDGQEVAVTTPYSGPVIGSHSASDLVHVEACKTVGTSFSRIIGVNSLKVCVDATAVKEITGAGGGTGTCGFCVVGTGDFTGIETTGSSSIAVVDGSIHSNSSSASSSIKSSSSGVDGVVYMSCTAWDPAATPPCTPSADADAITMVGDTGTDPSKFSPSPPVGGQAVISDPLETIPYPYHVTSPAFPTFASQVTHGSADCPATDGVCWLSPGVYYGGIKNGTGGTIRLNPGIYVIACGGCKFEFNHTPDPVDGAVGPAGHPEVSLWGEEVMIFLTCKNWPTPCTDGEKGAEFNMGSGAGMYLTAPTSGQWQGMAVFSDRNNWSRFKQTGSSFMITFGAIYAAGTELMELTGSSTNASAHSLIISRKAKLTGSTTIVVNYDPTVLPSVLGGGSSSPGGLVQ